MPMDVPAQILNFHACLQAAGTTQRAVSEKAYLKSDLDFFGVCLPVIHKTAKTFRKAHPDLPRQELLTMVEALWQTRYHELWSLGIALLSEYRQRLAPEDMVFIEALIRRTHTWAHVDWLATKIVSVLVQGDQSTRPVLQRWSTDENFWIRRAAMLALLDSARTEATDFELFAQFATAMIAEKEFFIRKAIGWVLREVSKHRPEPVYEFLQQQIDRVSGVTLREGAKYLHPEQRSLLLQRYAQRQR
jgi:3-methyladenine DNA glycosylase AlkD